MHNDDDHLALVEDLPDQHSVAPGEPTWTLLIVDDDADVHHATEFALHDLRVLGRPLTFLHAFSAAEAIAVLERHRDVAVVLLDVVMEREDAGLAAVGRIRQELGMTSVRIVLRTGQPGYAPELEAIANYDINDYKTKTELTRSKLFTTITAAIRSFDQIRRLDENRSTLELIIDGASRFDAESGVHAFAATVIEQLATLLGIPPAGLVCARLGDPAGAGAGAGREVILAAAGPYRALSDQPLAALGDHPVREMIAGCLAQRASQRGERALVLHFAGRHGRSFAAYIESSAPLRELDRHLLDIFCANLAIRGENVGLVERLRNAAYVDPLTRLPNRAAQIELIDRCAGGDDQVLALIDIDEFSETIDAFGYQFGDQQLCAVGQRLRDVLPPAVQVARVGSDLFGVYGQAATVNPENLRNILAAPFDNEGLPHTISFTLGLVPAADAACSGGDLLRNAAIALKRARRDGPGNTAYYTEEVGLQTRHRVHLLHDLRAALDSRQLIVAYQPQLDLLTNRVFGVEALLRWRDENGAYVPLEQVIPVAEQSGLIVDIGAWVLATALGVQRQLAAQGHALRMAVNVSPVQFRQPDFVSMVCQAIRAAGSDPAQLELEITESVALSGWKQVADHLAAIRALGVSIAIDDFGTGFSSLSYLSHLPADCLKIDRSFVRALDDQRSGTPIAAMVIQLAAQLGLRVLAEGVEDQRQLRTLLDLGCRAGQGLLYAPALEAAELLPWLRARARP